MTKTKQTEPTQEELGKFVEREVVTCQSSLVEELLKREVVSYDDVTNLYQYNLTDDEAEAQEIYEWWIVSSWLLEKLEAHGEPVLKTDFGDWWGRTCTGQAILLDSVIEEIFKEMRAFRSNI